MIIDPTTFPDWPTAFASSVLLELQPGDYTAMGDVQTFGFANVVVKAYEANTYPLVQRIIVVGEVATGGLFEGLAVKVASQCFNTSNQTIRDCRFINIGKDAIATAVALNMIDCTDCVIEDTWFSQENYQWMGDRSSIQFTSNGNKAESRGNIVRNCRFRNCNDAIQFNNANNGVFPDCLVENNISWITQDFYTQDGNAMTAENWADVKAGGLEGDPLVFRNNVVYGYRPTDNTVPGPGPSGSGGDFATVHVHARYVVFDGECYYNGSIGISIRNNGGSNLAQDITVQNCRFADIRFYPGISDSGKGVADSTPSGSNIVVLNNTTIDVPIPIESLGTVSGNVAIYNNGCELVEIDYC